ncbi:MAG: phosphate ABC transporter substrate-binding protein PstS [Candidatus Freyarchaeota archaeon]|nr:phosphate ABC transporter substrate-binding protein PstS [Candidatus Jordarchaeia archaeon]
MKKSVLVGISATVIIVLGIVLAAPYLQPKTETITQTSTTTSKNIVLNGAGATFPYPLISTWIVQYNKIYPNIMVNYQSIGSGGGIRQHTNKTVDFGASDAPLNEDQRKAAPNTLHIPITIGCIVIAYNLPNVPKGLKLTGELVAEIFLGNIKKWNDPLIANLNPEIQLPDKEIIVVHRSDGSGTTFVFTSYLSIVSSEWNSKVGKGTAVQWPTGLGAAGNEGVAGVIRGTPYTIGYVELAYALQTKMSYAYLKNKDGNFVEPSLESTAAAAEALSPILPKGDESWEKVSLLNAPGKNSYPIASFSYILVYKELSVLPKMDKEKAIELVKFLYWAIHDGQNYAPSLQYVPLPKSVVNLNEETIKSITFNGERIWDLI